MSTVEVIITSVERRRYWRAEQKRTMVEERVPTAPEPPPKKKKPPQALNGKLRLFIYHHSDIIKSLR